jgi:hypothetical protein
MACFAHDWVFPQAKREIDLRFEIFGGEIGEKHSTLTLSLAFCLPMGRRSHQ